MIFHSSGKINSVTIWHSVFLHWSVAIAKHGCLGAREKLCLQRESWHGFSELVPNKNKANMIQTIIFNNIHVAQIFCHFLVSLIKKFLWGGGRAPEHVEPAYKMDIFWFSIFVFVRLCPSVHLVLLGSHGLWTMALLLWWRKQIPTTHPLHNAFDFSTLKTNPSNTGHSPCE